MTTTQHSPLVERVAKVIATDRFRENGHGVLDDARWIEMRDWYFRHKDDPNSLSAHFSLPAAAYRQAQAALAASEFEEMRRELAQSATEVEEAAKLLAANGLSGMASIYNEAAARKRDLLARLDGKP